MSGLSKAIKELPKGKFCANTQHFKLSEELPHLLRSNKALLQINLLLHACQPVAK